MKRINSGLVRWASYYEPLWWLGAGLFFLGLVGILWGFTKPLTVVVSNPVPYRIQGLLLYSAPVPKDVFPTGQLPTGAPFSLSLTPQVTFRFLVRFSASPPYTLQGRGWLWMEVEDSLGWRRRLLQVEKTWTGDYWVLEARLPLRQVEDLIQRRNEVYPLAQSYQIVLYTRSTLEGMLENSPWREELQAQWVFSRFSDGFYVLKQGMQGDALKPLWKGTISKEEVAPNQVLLGPWTLSVRDLRALGLMFTVFGGLLLAGLQRWLGWARRHAPEAYFKASLGRLVVKVDSGPHLWSRGPYVRLETLEDVVRVANHFREPILYAIEGRKHLFFVWLPDVVYYALLDAPESAPSPDKEDEGGGNGVVDRNGLDGMDSGDER